ncbi:MAG: cyclic nucleotide-binding domain-containing protein [Chloroflexota bacterium]|nr:cyclic nucleotide-binding domain-containing protein [Chloroflexota bacterium]
MGPALVVLAWRRLQAIDRSMPHRDEEIAVLQQVAMLRVLPVPAIDGLALRVKHADIEEGTDVFRQGDVGDHLYVIADGEPNVVRDGRLLRTLRAGDAFGEIALLRKTTRTATVRARTRLRLYTLDGSDFVSAISGYPSSSREADTLMTTRLAT